MKILIVSQYFWPEDFRINDIAKGLKEAGHEVEILTGIPNYPSGKVVKGFFLGNKNFSELEGMRIYRTAMITRGNGNIRLALNYLTFMLVGTLRTIPLLFKEYDKIFVFQVSPITSAIPALFIAKFKKISSYIYVQDLWPETFYSIVDISNTKVRAIMQKVCNKIYNSFSNILIASEGYRKILKNNGIIDRKIKYFPQWAEDFYSNELVVKDIDREFTVTFAGNIGKAQSVHTIVKAAGIIRKKDLPIKFNIIGDGSEFNNVKLLIKELNVDNIKLLGRKSATEMPKYFSISDALLVTLNNDEILKVTLPAKIQSYMAAGRPIIGAISGEGNKLIVESKSGLAGEAEDYVALAENIIRVYKMNEKERSKLGRNGKEYFKKNFTREKLLRELESIIN